MILFDVKTHVKKRYMASLHLDSYSKLAMPKVFTVLLLIVVGTDTNFLNFESELALKGCFKRVRTYAKNS